MSDERPQPVLLPGDLISGTWHKLRKHMQERQASARKRIERDLDPTATAWLRGELEVYRNLLALDEPDPAIGADDDQG